ncbi:MAG: WecB/TagA/CpsF family glycosyltransferase [Tepidisphaeraceae bacterium]
MSDTDGAARPPRKHALFGVSVSATDYPGVVAFVMDVARRRGSAVVDLMPVHGLVTANRDASFRRMLNGMDVVAPDGQPVRWALNRFHGAGLTDRVYGPELTLRVCAAAAESGVGVYLYGSVPGVLEKLSASLTSRFLNLRLVGAESPPFRALTPEEDDAVVRRINDSGAGIVLIGLGCPKQEVFAFEHRDRIRAAMLCVGAAFDFHAGVKRIAPPIMQRLSLEWLFRLYQEPGRLWKRYLVTNSIFIYLVAAHWVRNRGFSSPLEDADVTDAVVGA